MAKQDTLTFKETMVEGDYLKTLSKEEKREYKKKSVEEKRKIIHEFNPQKFEPSNNEGNKIFNWIKKHKIWSGIIILLLIGGIGSIFTDSENTESEEPKKETATKQEKKESKQDSKEEKDAKEETKKPLTDEEKLNKELKKEVRSTDVKNVDFGVESSDVTIELDGKSSLSDKSTSRGFRMGTAEALYALKKANIDVNSADIYVYHELNDGMKDEEKMVMSSRWDKDTINSMNKDALTTLPGTIETHAESSFIHPVMRQSEK
ncbi:hypothetical protein FEZ53_06550 [Staphylococcus xylosus]|uniref:Uncharacterized protein n=1 Tax=Staphylococcus xylosus TaxID=1288 RepID=A0A5R9B7W4_STAXY|nr:hypothetical protein [Staphylococcus xylosus]TLP91942.1 hypothetical protein FEZ53_06550 [Staphylococcus xylosus]